MNMTEKQDQQVWADWLDPVLEWFASGYGGK